MYTPKHFEETNFETIEALVAAAPLATLVIAHEGEIIANHIPFVLRKNAQNSSQLLAHIPRSNPLSTVLATGEKCLAIFLGPEGYVSPSYYSTKQKHGKVVPTWNYAVVHVHGRARLVDDINWLRKQISWLTELKENSKPDPWKVSDAPVAFTNALLRSLVGIEITVERVEAKTKASQNQPEENQRSVLERIDREQPDSEFAKMMHSVLD